MFFLNTIKPASFFLLLLFSFLVKVFPTFIHSPAGLFDDEIQCNCRAKGTNQNVKCNIGIEGIEKNVFCVGRIGRRHVVSCR